MKKIIMAMMIAGLAYGGANAQTKVCGTNSGKVCRPSGNGKSCYKTKYAENYKVCKGNFGYYICCEAPNSTNATHPVFVVAENQQVREYSGQYPTTTQPADMTAQQSQSYTVTSSNSYEGNYPVRGRIKVCYTGDNVAQQNRNPYEGCPSPQYDGPDANRQRNVNVANPEPMPPLAGQPY